MSNERPAWVPQDLYPFEDRYLEIEGSRVHYIDEGTGPPLLLLHGNPTWSFLYREIIEGLRGDYRCIALDYPGFGLSPAAKGYSFTPAEHAHIVERLVLELDLEGVTMMVQDWGGPIGFGAATRQPERFTAFVIGNTWAWPKADAGTRLASRALGEPLLGGDLTLRRNFFVETVLPNNVKLRKLSDVVMNAYRGPFPTADSRRPMHVLPRELLASRPFLANIERVLRQPRRPARPARLADQRRRLPRARAATVGGDLPAPPHSAPPRCRPLHPGGGARADRLRDSSLVGGSLGLTRAARGSRCGRDQIAIGAQPDQIAVCPGGVASSTDGSTSRARCRSSGWARKASTSPRDPPMQVQSSSQRVETSHERSAGNIRIR